MHSLHYKMLNTSKFLLGVELVSIRGSMAEKSAQKARTFANQLVEFPEVDWISITDNAGGNPQMAPQALGKPILYAGKEVVIHLTCKDLNRNGLESEAWLLNSEGFHNILAMTGDYPLTGHKGMAKPVFDIDSVGLISMLNTMNQGFDFNRRGNNEKQKLSKTQFLIGAVTTNFKLREGEVMPQYLKLQKKVECGANFIINQIGFDSRKISELRKYMELHGMKQTPLIGNVYVLNPGVAKIFHEKKIPGVVVTTPLLEKCQKYKNAPDRGKSFFYELAAKQSAIYRGLGYRGTYIGGVSNIDAVRQIVEIEKSFGQDDWKGFAKEINYSRPKEFFFFEKEVETGLASAKINITENVETNPGKGYQSYKFSKWIHDNMFTTGTSMTSWFTKLCENAKDSYQGPGLIRSVEKVSKATMFGCKDCGDCSLPNIAFLCPENHCAKNQRNGPCGGTKEGQCEVDGIGECIWLRAYNRLKADGQHLDLLQHSPMVQNQGLRNTSAWANNWLKRDHAAVDPQENIHPTIHRISGKETQNKTKTKPKEEIQ